ncbi:MAG: hypothetical protein J6H18_03390 [Lachnospiraceae bacterium]|nr:hypothetical protein [Lachnospiraceae bacterium]
MILDFTIHTIQDMKAAVEGFGFLPLFANSIPGFSIEEHAAKEVWYQKGSDDWKIWEWKGPVIRECGCAYGKFWEKKAAFVSREWFGDFANFRRDGYDFDARWDDGLAFRGDKELYELIEANAPLTSKRLKRIGGYGKEGKKGFETCLGRLQSQAYVTICDFVYPRNRQGESYGWGMAEYTTPELWFGPEFRRGVYQVSPEESGRRILGHLKEMLPGAKEESLSRALRKI